MKRILVILLGVATIVAGMVRADDSESKSRAPRLDLWREILSARVNARGEVAYRTLATADGERLETFIRSLVHADLDRMDGAEAAALWINAYNAGVLWGVLHGGRPETVQGRARLYAWLEIDVGGKRRTLDGIQAELARYAAADPRIHLALCNGARSAPALLREPYDAYALDDHLARAASDFVNDHERNRIKGKRAALSPVFAWHRTDFTREAGAIGAWVAKHLHERNRSQWIGAENAQPRFLDFDWRLNAAPEEDPAQEARASTARR